MSVGSQPFTIIMEQGTDGYLLGEVLELPGCRTQAKTQDELLMRMREAIDLYKEVNQPWNTTSKFLGIQRLEYA